MSTGLSDHPVGLDELYEAHFGSLVKVAFLLTGSSRAAEDAVHEVFVRCLPRLAQIDHPASYLRTAVVNECRTQYRQRQRADDRHRLLASDADRSIAEDLPHELMETREALASLTERQRAAIVLRYFVDVPDTEIATILECRPATVRSLIRRALIQLREELS